MKKQTESNTAELDKPSTSGAETTNTEPLTKVSEQREEPQELSETQAKKKDSAATKHEQEGEKAPPKPKPERIRNKVGMEQSDKGRSIKNKVSNGTHKLASQTTQQIVQENSVTDTRVIFFNNLQLISMFLVLEQIYYHNEKVSLLLKNLKTKGLTQNYTVRKTVTQLMYFLTRVVFLYFHPLLRADYFKAEFHHP